MPLAFPSWEGLGVGSSCLLPTPYSLLPSNCYTQTVGSGTVIMDLILTLDLRDR
ncbi:MAG: hypothetical protein F6J90_07490 [Moorea sp. SIOASIH]|uniref:hypothetical protein n=1 Tax=Moorena sp. SIOASIH TaxID=2607817 RepID=UPI0013BBABCB|nr:hypothetical protein [Moorena sp. SIOASIH]NEO36175.1 hypothetical protein [Moorena sp. SIOASIH]NEO96767.1 hypothetical protein [Moorena sp. SIO3G5]